jgi:hypothetical protein
LSIDSSLMHQYIDSTECVFEQKDVNSKPVVLAEALMTNFDCELTHGLEFINLQAERHIGLLQFSRK